MIKEETDTTVMKTKRVYDERKRRRAKLKNSAI